MSHHSSCTVRVQAVGRRPNVWKLLGFVPLKSTALTCLSHFRQEHFNTPVTCRHMQVCVQMHHCRGFVLWESTQCTSRCTSQVKAQLLIRLHFPYSLLHSMSTSFSFTLLLSPFIICPALECSLWKCCKHTCQMKSKRLVKFEKKRSFWRNLTIRQCKERNSLWDALL